MSGPDPALREVLAVVADRLERRGLVPQGRVRLTGLDRPARHAVGGLLGRVVVADHLTVELAELDEVVRIRLGMPGGIRSLCERVLDRPLVDRAASRRARELERDNALQPLRDLDRAWASAWAMEVGRAGLLARTSDPAAAAAHAVAVVREVLPAGGGRAWARTELAARVCGSAHALDDGGVLAAVVLRGLAHEAEVAAPTTVRERRALWGRFGVAVDRVSTTVLTLGLRSTHTDRVGRWLAEAADAYAPVHLTARDVAAYGAPVGMVPALVCENPRVLEAAADLEVGWPVVCTMGRPTTVVLQLLRSLSGAGTELRYHGDFDWPGIAIAADVAVAAGAVPWRMSARDYLNAVARHPGGVPLAGPSVASPWDPELSEAMSSTGVTVHEELLLPDLLTDD